MNISEYVDLIFSNPPKELKHSLIKHINEDTKDEAFEQLRKMGTKS